MNLIKKYFKKVSLGVFLMATLSSCSWDEGDINLTADPNNPLIPVASFSVSETDILKKESITFVNTSTNNPTLFTWNFEGGSPSYSNEPNPTIKYTLVGSFKVSLTVRNTHGSSNIVYENYINVTGIPLDPSITMKLNFEGKGFLNEGSAGGTATTSGSPIFTTGIVDDDAYTLSGTNALTLPDYTGVNGNNSRTVSLWIKTTQAANAGIVHWGASGTYSRSSFKLNSNGTIRYEFQGGGLNGVTAINNDRWHHIAYTYNGSNVIIYVDGIEDSRLNNSLINTGVAGETMVYIGSQAGASLLTGSIDDIRIYNKAITSEEMAVLFKK